jgi:hypothetical protein
MATLEARGHVSETDAAPRVDDLLRLFAKIGLQLPTHDPVPLPVPDPKPKHDDEPTLRFPPRVPEPVRHAA